MSRYFPEPPPLHEILKSLKEKTLRQLARKIGVNRTGNKEQLTRAIVNSAVGRRTILSSLKVVDLVKICQRFHILSERGTRKARLVLRLCWRVFIVHRRSALEVARVLKGLLSPNEPIFLDAEGIREGTAFPREINDAVNSAQGYVVLVSNDFQDSHWTLEELTRAIAYHTNRHAPVCPLFLDGMPKSPDEIPYGLNAFPLLDGSQLDISVEKINRTFSSLPR